MELHLANNVSNLLFLLFKSDTHTFLSTLQLFLQTFFSTKCSRFWRVSTTRGAEPLPRENDRVTIEEMNMLINRLGASSPLDGSAGFGVQDFVALFEEEEPSLDEIKEVFNVFDANKDGFIDAGELQRVVGGLGYEVEEECEKMIMAFDADGDGLIGFHDFVNFMERCLC